MALWKRIVLISASFGLGVVIAIAAIWGGVIWYEAHRVWNARALKATFATMEFDTEPSQDSYVMKFFYDLQNNTSKNYQINPNGFTVMAYLTEGNVLSKEAGSYQTSTITVEGPPFIPPHGKARITLRTSYQYPSEFTAAEKADLKKVIPSVDRRLKEFNGFVLFDQESHYRIELELPVQKEAAPPAKVPDSGLLPCSEKDPLGLFTKEPCKPKASKDLPPCPTTDPVGLKTSQPCAPLPSKVKE